MGKDEQGDFREISSNFLKVTAWREEGLLFYIVEEAGGSPFPEYTWEDMTLCVYISPFKTKKENSTEGKQPKGKNWRYSKQ